MNVEDGSFLRLKQLSLAYNLPVEKMGWNKIFKSVNVYVSGNNVFLISDFKLGDPEVNNFTSSSTNNSFGGVSQGFATGQYPYAKSFTLGAKLQF